MLIMKFEMLKVKHLTLFKPKKCQKVGIFTKAARKIKLCSILLLQNFVFYWMQVILWREA